MPILSAHQACSETRDLWTGIAREAEKGRHREKEEIPGPWQKYFYNCPCCEHIKDSDTWVPNCNKCPMKQEWTYFLDATWPIYNYFCCKGGPYFAWSIGKPSQNNTLSCYDLSFFAWLIVELAEEAMERIRKEGEGTL